MHPARRRLAFLSAAIAALAAVLAVVMPSGTASAAGRPAAETRVWAISAAAHDHVRASGLVSPGQRLGDPTPCPFCVSGACVAPEEAGGSGEVYYRTMSGEHYASLQATGRVSATRETFISPTASFSSTYEGTMVRFVVRPGTTDALANIGVRDSSAMTSGMFPDIPLVSKGWTATSAFFKGEGNQINIGLGRGPALDIFNNAITDWEQVPK
jgi:hypothetical protein